MRALLVEDDDLLASGIQRALKREGYQVDWVNNGLHARQALTTDTFDVIVLDLNLPGMDGLDVLTQARAAKLTTPVLILSARDTLDDRVAGLDSGADDYLVKPFELVELKARLRALSRRAVGQTEPVLQVGAIALNPETRQVLYHGQEVTLSRREYSLLWEFMRHPTQVFSREQLESKLYGWGEGVSSNSLEVHISSLRKKFRPELIKTLRGIGYRFMPQE